jgi:hypothetical protein
MELYKSQQEHVGVDKDDFVWTEVSLPFGMDSGKVSFGTERNDDFDFVRYGFLVEGMDSNFFVYLTLPDFFDNN